MELKEAKKILKDDGYVISYSDLEDKAVNQMEDLVTLAATCLLSAVTVSSAFAIVSVPFS